MAKALGNSRLQNVLGSATPAVPVYAAPEGGLLKGQADRDADSTVGVAESGTQSAVAPRADMPGPWFVTNLGPNTLYLGPSGVTSSTGTPVSSGAKSAAIAATAGFTTFAICASGQVSLFQVTNH